MRKFFVKKCHCWRRRCFRAACKLSVADQRSASRCKSRCASVVAFIVCVARRDSRNIQKGSAGNQKEVATSFGFCSNVASKSLFSLRTERVSERRKRQTGRKDEADIVELVSVLLRSLSVNKLNRFVYQNNKTLMV